MTGAALTALQKEAGELAPLVAAYEALQSMRHEVDELETLASDSGEGPDMHKMAVDEAARLRPQAWRPVGAPPQALLHPLALGICGEGGRRYTWLMAWSPCM